MASLDEQPCGDCGAPVRDQRHFVVAGDRSFDRVRCERCMILAGEDFVTHAGRQVERALADGHAAAAEGIYLLNLRDGVTMGGMVWHRRMQAAIRAEIGPPDTIADELAEVFGPRATADMLGIPYAEEDRDDDIRALIRRDLELAEPSLVERVLRNSRGEVVRVELVSNPKLAPAAPDRAGDRPS
jgi:hypothetical protein